MSVTALPPSERDKKRRLWPLAIIALVLAAFFHSMLTLSRVPWISDIKSYYYPAWRYLAHAFRSGGPSLWCSGIYCGFPLFADSEMGLFYPVNLLFFQLPATAGFNYCIILHYLLGGVFTYMYCRRLRLGRSASLFAALPFTLGGFFLAHMVHPNAVATAAWMPLFLYCLERALSEGKPSFHLAAGGVLGLQCLSGFLMIPLMQALLAFFYLLSHSFDEQGDRRRFLLINLAWLILALGLGVCLGMVQNLPSYHLVQNSYRAGGLSEKVAGIGSMPPAQLLGIVLPRLFGRGLAQGGYLGAWTFEETYAYMGVLPILFASAALLRPRRRHAAFFFWMGTVSLLLSLGRYGLLWSALRHLPGFNVLKGSSRFILTFNLSLAVLGGMGFERWRSGEFPSRMARSLSRAWLRVAAAAAALAAIPVLLYRFDVLGFRDLAAAAAKPFLAGIKLPTRRVLDGLVSFFTAPRLDLLLPPVMLALFLLLIRADGEGEYGPSRLKVFIAVGLAVVDVFAFGNFVLKPVPRERADFKPQVIGYLKENAGDARVALAKEPGVDRGEFPLCSNQLLPYGLEDAFGFSTIPPARLDRFLALVNDRPEASAFELLGVGLLYSNLSRVQGTTYDLSDPYPIPGGLGAVSYAFPSRTSGRELRLLVDGSILEPSASGRLCFKLNSIINGRVVKHPVLFLHKDSGPEEYFLAVIDAEQTASFERVRFRSPGHGEGREALEIRVPLPSLGEADELILTTLCDPALEGTRIAAVTAIDKDGRRVPLTAWPSVYCDGKNAVYELPNRLTEAYAAWEVSWSGSWGEAVDRAFREDLGMGEVVLVESEIGPETRKALTALSPPEREPSIEVAESGGDGMALRVRGDGDFILVVSLDFMPGWRATVDGEEAPLFSANGFLTALHMKRGEHVVLLSYRPPGLASGAAVSSLSLALLVFLFMLSRRKEGRAAEPTSLETPVARTAGGSISAFFPCYNDSATLKGLIEKALAVLDDLADDYEVIVVDDGSADSSGEVIDQLAASYEKVRVVRHDRNRGYGAALRSGIRTSTKDWVFYTDSDGQYEVEDLRLLHAMSGDADVVNGFKTGRSDAWYRKFLGWAYNRLVRFAFAIPIRDVDCDFRLMRGELVRSLDLRSEGGAICVELVKELQAAGAVFAEAPVGHYPRAEGRSQFFRLKNLLVMAREIAALWWRMQRKGVV